MGRFVYPHQEMKNMLSLILSLASVVAGESAQWSSPHSLQAETEAPVALLPFPRVVKWGEAMLDLPPSPCWNIAPNSACAPIMQSDGGSMLSTACSRFLHSLPCPTPLRSKDRPVTLSLSLESVPALPAEGEQEGYRLVVNAQGVSICAPRPAGLFNALQTLRQLVLPGRGQLPFCEITDWPSFPVRGFHHDCGRNYQTIESLKRQLELASRLKVNYFHWHLADDPAWHVQCKAYPQLNDPQYRTRDKNDTYSYAEIREILRYAHERHITVIPELDMPGHSDYFTRAFGFPMHSEQGMRVLEKLIDEFCAEIPATLCPILHFGADEVSVPNAEQFVERISRKIRSHGRTPMQWEGPWDLPVSGKSIAQRWVQGKSSQKAESITSPTIDSSIGYSNLFEPALLVRRWFFMRPCGAEKGDDVRLGAIFCTWPDIRVEDKSRIPLHSPMWPGLCAMAERAWNGAGKEGDAFTVELPPPDTEPGRAFSLFECRLVAVGRTIFKDEHFPYWAEKGGYWEVTQPVPDARADEVRKLVLAGGDPGELRRIFGCSLYFRTRAATWSLGIFAEARPGVRVWARSHVFVEEEGDYPFMIGFDAPTRSNRQYTGIPREGEWSQCGTRIWVNGVEIRNSRHYANAGGNRIAKPTWHTAEDEHPIQDEDIWWAQSPTPVHLKKGVNSIVVEQPYTDVFQSWEISFIPADHRVRWQLPRGISQ